MQYIGAHEVFFKSELIHPNLNSTQCPMMGVGRGGEESPRHVGGNTLSTSRT